MTPSTADVAELGTILGIWSHPDDEAYLSAATMAAAIDNGQRVVVATATRGERGNPEPGRWSIDHMRSIRTRELDRALEIIGVTEGTRCSIVRVDNDVELLNALAFTADGQGAFKASTTFAYVSDTAVRLSAAASGKVVAGIAENSGAFTDETLEANDSRGTESMTLLTAAPTIDVDGFYYGHTEQFGQLELDITTAGTGGFVMQWQYWNGSAWTALSGVTDGTSNLSVTGSVIVSWTIPGNWTARSVTNQPGPSNLFYVRQMYQSGTVTVLPVGNTVKLDVTKYRRWEATNTIVSAGLSAKATWVVDDIAVFG